MSLLTLPTPPPPKKTPLFKRLFTFAVFFLAYLKICSCYYRAFETSFLEGGGTQQVALDAKAPILRN
jgi:hypothetical protein